MNLENGNGVGKAEDQKADPNSESNLEAEPTRVSEKRLAANRKNALKSTGPKSASGKARSSRNALRHGILSTSPVLVSIERRKSWEEHQDLIFDAVSPVGYLEEMLAHDLAIVSWRRSRATRCEAKVIVDCVRTAETEFIEHRALEHGKANPGDSTEEVAVIALSARAISMFEALPSKSAEEKLEADTVRHALCLFVEELPEDVGYVKVPGVPEDELDGFEDWTAALFRDVVNAYASASKKSPESFLEQCIESAAEKHNDAICEVRSISDNRRNWDLLLARERSKALVNPGILDTIARYDTTCERSFFRILHEIQRLQAIRRGAAVPAPAVVEVDMTTRREDKN